MVSDSTTALVVVVLLLVVIAFKQFSTTLLNLLLGLTRPGASILMLSVILGLLYKNYFYTALATTVLTVLLLKDVLVKYAYSDARRLNAEVARDLARFDPNQSIDLQFANKTVSHDPPALYGKPSSTKGLLIFPPSKELLHEMCGE
jgi:hypothetical protein